MIAHPRDTRQTPSGTSPEVSPEAAFGALERQSPALEEEIGKAIARQVAGRRALRQQAHAQRLLEASGQAVPAAQELPPEAMAALAASSDDQDEPEEIGGRGSRLRRCIVTGEIFQKDDLIRFAISPDGVVTPDLDACLPGRGYWVQPRTPVLERAVSTNAFSKAARRAVSVPPDLVGLVVRLARQNCLRSLGLARRAWQLEMGYDFVRQALMSGKAGVVFVASNAPADFAGKLDDVRKNTTFINLFSTEELSAALGRDKLAFVSINKGQWSLRLLIECQRVAQLCAA